MNRKMLYKQNKKSRKFSISFAILVILSVIPFPFLFSSNRKCAFGATVLFYSLFSLVLLIILTTAIYSLIMNIKSSSKSIAQNINKVSIRSILMITDIGFVSYSSISKLPNYYEDIPKIITSEYPSVDGKLTNLSLHRGRGASTKFIIDGIKFSIDGIPSSDFLAEGKKYHVCYLPNSKFVIKIQCYNE